jgi:uncharacterized protein
MERWVSFSLRHSWTCVLGWVLITALAIWFARDLKIKTDLASLLPKSYPSVRELDRVKAKVGGLEKVILVIESPDSTANRRFAVDMATRLRKRDDIGLVEIDRDLSYFTDKKLLYLDFPDLVKVYQRVQRRASGDIMFDDDAKNPLDFSDIEAKYKSDDSGKRDGWASEDGTRRLVKFFPLAQSANVGKSRELINMSKAEVAAQDPARYHPDMVVFYGGEYKNRMVEYDVIVNDIVSTAALAIGAIIILISLYFRQWFAFLFIGFPLIAGLSWTFGITTLAIGNLNLITGFLFAVLAGLGIDFGIHVFSRYVEERGNGHDLSEAVMKAVINTGEAITTSAMTTVAAFYSLMITDFKGFSEFGFIAGTGIIMTLAAILLSFPSLIALGERLHLVRHRQNVKEWKKSTGDIPFARPVVVGFIALLIVGVVLGSYTTFDYDFTNLRANLPSANAVKSKISSVQSQETAPAAIVAESAEARLAIRNELEARRDANPDSYIREIRTLEGFLPKDQRKKMGLIKRLRRVVDRHLEKILKGQTDIDRDEIQTWVHVRPQTPDSLPGYVRRKFMGPDGSFGDFVVVGTSAQLRDGLQAIRFADEVRHVKTKDHGGFYASGSAIIMADMLKVMRHDSVIAISVTFLVVLAIVLVDFGTRRATIIALIPLILDILVAAVGRVFGFSLDIGNLTLAGIFIGELVFIVVANLIFERESIRTAAIVVSPVLGGIVLMLGMMTVFGIKLNFYNMVVLPSIIGMGIDNGVHLYHRYNEEGPGSLKYVLRTTGAAVFMASLTTMVGFSGMVIATHQGLNSMGDVAVIGMVTCLIMSVVFMPALLVGLEKRYGHPSERGNKQPRPELRTPEGVL